MEATYNSYSRWSFFVHVAILFAESFTMWTVQNAILRLLPNIFWTRAFVCSFFMLLAISHYFIANFDLIFGYGLLMRFGSSVPFAYYLVKPPTLFDETLPTEGQAFKESMGVAFIKHCWRAYKEQGTLVFLWMGLVVLLIVVRSLIVVIKSYCMVPKQTKQRVISLKMQLSVAIPTICLFLFYVMSFKSEHLDEFVPSHWYFYRTAVKHQMPH